MGFELIVNEIVSELEIKWAGKKIDNADRSVRDIPVELRPQFMSALKDALQANYPDSYIDVRVFGPGRIVMEKRPK